jgi:menaquinone-specific isochorismate synthase
LLADFKQRLKENYNQEFYLSYFEEIEKFNFHSLLNYTKQNKKKALFWSKPSEKYSFIAIDKVIDFPTGKEDLVNQINKIRNNIRANFFDKEELKIPNIVGGIKFNNGENSVWKDFIFNDWFLPRFVFLKNGDKYYLIVNVAPEEDLDKISSGIDKIYEIATDGEDCHKQKHQAPKLVWQSEIGKEEWSDKISRALDLIKKEEVSKIVISRFIHNKITSEVNYSTLLNKLSENFPYCTIFGYQSNNSFFFGATPETLFSVYKSSLETDALAGSISRGKTIYEDEILANELLSSDKNLREHRKVVEFILSQLEKHAKTIVYRDVPKIRKLRNIQHLWTPIKAQLNENANLLSLLYDLHPTPAVCGSPKEKAHEKIYEIENFERGLFTGVIGWLNFNNIGDFSVAIRSALINNNDLYAYAGCGIVKGSDAAEEFSETELKLKPILNLFEEDEY